MTGRKNRGMHTQAGRAASVEWVLLWTVTNQEPKGLKTCRLPHLKERLPRARNTRHASAPTPRCAPRCPLLPPPARYAAGAAASPPTAARARGVPSRHPKTNGGQDPPFAADPWTILVGECSLHTTVRVNHPTSKILFSRKMIDRPEKSRYA